MVFRLLTLAVCALGMLTTANAENEHIFNESFESTRILDLLGEEVLEPGESISAGGLTIIADGAAPTSIAMFNAISRHMEPVLHLAITGGNVTLNLSGLSAPNAGQQLADAAAPILPCPDLPGNFPLNLCVGHWPAYFAVTIDVWNEYPLEGVRIPNNSGIFKENYVTPDERLYDLRMKDGSRLYSANCTDFSVCDAEPVLFVHGYQKEPRGGEIDDNGGTAYWGNFPLRLINDGYRPFEFKWLTNARFEDVAYDLASAVSKIKSLTGKSVHIVAHSMGGILSRRMLQTFPVNNIAASIATVTFIGTPHNGIFENVEAYLDVKFPEGQENLIFWGCNQISCHLLGEQVLNETLANLLDIAPSPGADAYFLAHNTGALPALRMQSLIGFQKEDDILVDNVSGGDGLIRGEGQRFHPTLVFTEAGESKWEAPLFRRQLGLALVNEYFLGRKSADEGDPYLEPYGQPFPTDFVAFKHSPGTVKISELSYDLNEPFVLLNEFHDGYQRVMDWIEEGQLPPDLKASPRVVEQGSDSTLSWNTQSWNETECTLTGGSLSSNPLLTDGGDPHTGSVTLQILALTTFTLTCQEYSDSVTVEVIPGGGET